MNPLLLNSSFQDPTELILQQNEDPSTNTKKLVGKIMADNHPLEGAKAGALSPARNLQVERKSRIPLPSRLTHRIFPFLDSKTTTLDLSSFQETRGEQLLPLLQKHPHLQEITIRSRPDTTDKDLELLATHCPSLKKLTLSGCPENRHGTNKAFSKLP